MVWPLLLLSPRWLRKLLASWWRLLRELVLAVVAVVDEVVAVPADPVDMLCASHVCLRRKLVAKAAEPSFMAETPLHTPICTRFRQRSRPVHLLDPGGVRSRF